MQPKQPNKSQFFSLEIKLDNRTSQAYLDESLDSILRVLSVKDECYGFQHSSGLTHMLFFKTQDRKRVTNLNRILNTSLPTNHIVQYNAKSLSKNPFYVNIENFKSSGSWELYKEPLDSLGYDGSDLKLFEDINNLYPWQRKIYEMIFDENKNIKSADDRRIITIVDETGNKGKSSFIKYLCWSRLESISKIGFGQSGQLRSAVISEGPKEVYIIDLPRTRGRSDNIQDLIAVIEEIKNGFLTSPMYGKSKKLLMPSPMIFVFSNSHLPYELLSRDRWECYTIDKSKSYDLKRISIANHYVKSKIKK